MSSSKALIRNRLMAAFMPKTGRTNDIQQQAAEPKRSAKTPQKIAFAVDNGIKLNPWI